MHTNPEVLALVALGEREAATSEDLDHIARCDSCERELSELGHLSQVGRTISDHFTLETPSPAVWNRIRDQLGFGSDFSSELVPPAVNPNRAIDIGPTPRPTPISGAQSVVPSSPSGPADQPDGIAVPSRHKRRRLSLALAAVLALLAGIGGTLAWQRLQAPTETVVASTALAALPDWSGAAGEATLEEDPAGRKILVVTMETPRPVDGIQQVWLIDRNVSGMVPVGMLTQPIQRFVLSSDVDVSRFPVVDVSVEAPDGNPVHSGNSIVRGTFDV